MIRASGSHRSKVAPSGSNLTHKGAVESCCKDTSAPRDDDVLGLVGPNDIVHDDPGEEFARAAKAHTEILILNADVEIDLCLHRAGADREDPRRSALGQIRCLEPDFDGELVRGEDPLSELGRCRFGDLNGEGLLVELGFSSSTVGSRVMPSGASAQVLRERSLGSIGCQDDQDR